MVNLILANPPFRISPRAKEVPVKSKDRFEKWGPVGHSGWKTHALETPPPPIAEHGYDLRIIYNMQGLMELLTELGKKKKSH